MLILNGRAEIERGLTLPLAPELHDLIAARLRHLTAGEHDLADMTVIAVFEDGDTDADLIAAFGWGLLTNPFDGAIYPSPDYQPWVDYVYRASAEIVEVIVAVGNDGWAAHVLILGEQLSDSRLIAWCRDHTL